MAADGRQHEPRDRAGGAEALRGILVLLAGPRRLDRARAAFYEGRGLHTVCPTSTAKIDAPHGGRPRRAEFAAGLCRRSGMYIIVGGGGQVG